MGRNPRNDQRNRDAARNGYPQAAAEDNTTSTTTTTAAEEAAQQQAMQSQLNTLSRETQSSRDEYSGDLVTVSDCLAQLGENSLIANTYSDKIRQMLSSTTYYDNYDSAISAINNTHV